VKDAGPFPRKLAMILWDRGWDQAILVNYYIWPIEGKNETIVVGAGTGLPAENCGKNSLLHI